MLRDPASSGRQTLVRFIEEFVTRYRGRHTILFYELTNELNLFADIELTQKCPSRPASTCAWSDFSTNDMIEFSRSMVHLIKTLDPTRLVTSGYSAPRPAALHLTRRPAFAPGGPDWTPDTPAELRQYLLAVHEPFDVISIHVYPTNEDTRFGRAAGHQHELVADGSAAAKAAGKPLFVGEFGDVGVTPFVRDMLGILTANRVAYAAVWVWEFYQTSTYETRNTEPTRYSVEPGYSDDLIGLLMQAERRLGEGPPGPSAAAAPRVVLTWPAPCAAIDRPIDLAAVASDGIKGAKSVDFLVDGHVLATSAAPPYRAHFDPVGLGRRTAEIEVRAYGASGASAKFDSVVRLNGDKSSCGALR